MIERKATPGRRESKISPWWKQAGVVLELLSGLSSRGRGSKECGTRVVRDRPSEKYVDTGAMPTKAVG